MESNNMKNIEEILNKIDDLIDNSSRLFNKGIVDTDLLRDYIDDIRVNMPDQIRKAQNISEKEAEIINRAKKESEAIIKKAEDRARVLITNEEVVKKAQAKANEIINNAQMKQKEIKKATNEYADMTLKRAEEALAKSLNDVKSTRNGIQQMQRKFGVALPSHQESEN